MAVPALKLPSVESSPLSTAKPTRSERRQAIHARPQTAGPGLPQALRALEATPPNSHRSEELVEVRLCFAPCWNAFSCKWFLGS